MTITGNGGKSKIGSIITGVDYSKPRCWNCNRNVEIPRITNGKKLCPHCGKELK